MLALTSQYGEIEPQGLYEYLHESDIKIEECEDYRFPEVNLDSFEDEYFREKETVDKGSSVDNKSSVITCPHCKKEFDPQE